MSRPDPIEYAERLYGAIRAANFSPMSFLAFGNAIKEGVAMRCMPRIAVEPFMRIVGEMLDLEEQADQEEIIDTDAIEQASSSPLATQAVEYASTSAPEAAVVGPMPAVESSPQAGAAAPSRAERRRNGGSR